MGLSPDDIVGRTSLDPRWGAIHEDGSPFPGEQHPSMETLRTGIPASGVTMGLRLPDDSLRWISINTQPLFHAGQPQPYGVVASFADITERKRAEEALRQSEERFRKVFESGPVGMALVGTDYRFVKVNAALCEMVGYAEPELTTLTFPDITHPDDLDADLDLVRRLERGEIARYQLEKRYFRKDGVLVWIMLTVATVRDQTGKLLYFLSIIEDITARKHAEEALRQSEERYRLLAENSTDLIAGHRPDGVFLYASAACRRLLGYAPEELIGHLAYEFFHPDDLPAPQPEGRSLVEVWESGAKVFRFRRKDGAYLWFETTSRAVRHPVTGAVEEIITVSRDVSERVRIQQELERVSRLNELILASAGEGIYGQDAQGNVTFVNPTAARLLGYTPEELLGQHVHEVLHHSHNDGAPYPAEQCPICAALREGTIHRVEDEVFWRRDGSPFPVEYQSSPAVRDGKIIGAVVVFRDISERKRAEADRARLLEAERRARHAAEAAQCRLEVLAEAGARLSASLDYSATLRQVA
ncbi:MAG: PAS domain S-box protein, partial [Chloroflexi bacterium]|nr:PAS domain S-box protein [Chloroflexota bacterium]